MMMMLMIAIVRMMLLMMMIMMMMMIIIAPVCKDKAELERLRLQEVQMNAVLARLAALEALSSSTFSRRPCLVLVCFGKVCLVLGMFLV